MDMAAILVRVMWHKLLVLTFIPPSQEGSTWYLASIGLVVSKEKKYWKCWIWVTLAFDIHKA